MNLKQVVSTVVTAAAVFMLPASATAADFSYNYAEFGYVLKADLDGFDGDGFRLRGSLEVAPNIIVLGDLNALGLDGSVDVTQMFVGAGYVMRQDERFDLIGSFELGRVKLKGPGGSVSETGFRLSGGVRAIVVPKVEGFAKLVYVNASGSDLYVEGGAMYQISSQLSVGGSIELGGDLDQFTAFARFTF